MEKREIDTNWEREKRKMGKKKKTEEYTEKERERKREGLKRRLEDRHETLLEKVFMGEEVHLSGVIFD